MSLRAQAKQSSDFENEVSHWIAASCRASLAVLAMTMKGEKRTILPRCVMVAQQTLTLLV